MRKRFFLGLLVVMVLIWGPIWLWTAFDLDESRWARIPLIAGIALGGYLLWSIVVRSLIGRDDS